MHLERGDEEKKSRRQPEGMKPIPKGNKKKKREERGISEKKKKKDGEIGTSWSRGVGEPVFPWKGRQEG